MTEKQRFTLALERKPLTGRVPHFELVFFLTMEAIGKVHPLHRNYFQWDQMSFTEKKLQLQDMASCYISIAQKYQHSAIFVHPNPGDVECTAALLEIIRERTGDEYFLMMHGDPTFKIPGGEGMMEFSIQLYEQPDALKEEAKKRVENKLAFAAALSSRGKGLLDCFALCSDYCFNTNPFFSPELFDQFIAPYLRQAIQEYKALGYYTIKHSDGNIMPILQQIADCGPHGIHSLDPQGGVQLSEAIRLVGDKVCLIGNVNCGLLQTGTEQECAADVRRSLREGMAAPGYIFSTSNCVYTGLPLERYHLMHRIWMQEGHYPA